MNSVQARFKAALELRDLMIFMRRARLHRDHPDADVEWIERRLEEWVVGRESHSTVKHQAPP